MKSKTVSKPRQTSRTNGTKATVATRGQALYTKVAAVNKENDEQIVLLGKASHAIMELDWRRLNGGLPYWSKVYTRLIKESNRLAPWDDAGALG